MTAATKRSINSQVSSYSLLADGGIYICEDLHASYWPDYRGGYRRKGTFIEVSKQLIDDMHVDFHSWWQRRNRDGR
jgi:hypothetical protein